MAVRFRDADPNKPGIQIAPGDKGTPVGPDDGLRGPVTNRTPGVPIEITPNEAINLASNNRMVQNRTQGVQRGAESPQRQTSRARIVERTPGPDDGTRGTTPRTPGSSSPAGEWRVRLSVPSAIQNGGALGPLSRTNNQVIFPFNPSILFGSSANYNQVHPIHVNYPYNAYQNSQIDSITISGEFLNETKEDGEYFLSVIHYLRTMTKMFYGDSNPQGNPPLIARLNGYGNFVLNNIPVVIQNYTMDLGTEVDYIQVDKQGQNYVPTQTLVTVTCLPQYSRRVQSGFSLNTFAEGGYVGGSEGFI